MAIFSISRTSRCWPLPTRAMRVRAASPSILQAVLPCTRPITQRGSSHGLGAACSRTSPPAAFAALTSGAAALPRAISTSTVSGGTAASADTQRLQRRRLPGVDLLGEDVPRTGGEGEGQDRRHHVVRRGARRVEVLQGSRAVLGLGALAQAAAPLVDLRVVVAVDEVDGLEVGHALSLGARVGGRRRMTPSSISSRWRRQSNASPGGSRRHRARRARTSACGTSSIVKSSRMTPAALARSIVIAKVAFSSSRDSST